MQLHLGTSSEFDKSLHEIKGKYGKEMIELEGLTPEQLDPLRFFRNFVGSKTVADISSDASSNVNGKNMNTMISESNKPLSKLLCYNKMFVEIEEKKGLDRAKEWLEQSINGGIYNHDASTITTKAYCYYGKENIVINYKNKIHHINFEDLYDLLEEDEIFLDDNLIVKCKYSNDLQVKDIVNGEEVWTKVIRVMYKPKPEGIHLRDIKYSNGLSQIVTDEHPIITINKGDVSAENIKIGDKVYTHKYTKIFTDSIREINNIQLNKDLGWLFGMILAEGGVYVAEGKYEFISFCQSISQNPSILERVFKTLERLDINMNHHINKGNYVFTTSNKDLIDLYNKMFDGSVSYAKRLNKNFIHFDKEFLYGLFSGLFDGDGSLEGFEKRRCMLRLSTRTLLNQISSFLQEEGFTVRDRIPYLKNRKGSFITRKTMYGIGFTLSENENLIKNFNSLKINKDYVPLKRNWNSKNKQYMSTYGEVSVIRNEIIESLNEEVYVYDISTETGHFLQNGILSHNCYAMTFEDIVNNGLWWEEGMSSKAPKHIKTFNSHIFQTLSKMANNLSGAVGMPDVLIYMYYFLMKDIETGYLDKKDIVREREQSWQEFIFNLNQNYLRESGTQSCYSNISVFDRDYFIGMFGEKTFPDGTMMIEHIEPFMQYQKDFLEYETRLRREKFFTFPVITASIIFKDDKFQDEDFVKYIAEHNIEFGDANVYISDTADNLSSCCFDENQKVLVKDSKNGVINTTFKEFHKTKYKEKPNYKIFHNGNWVCGKSVKIPLDNKKMFKVTTSNNKEMILTEDHISLTDRGDVKTFNLNTNDYLAFNTQVLQPTPENNLNLTYEQGILIGAYLGDGSIGKNGYDTILSINEEKAKILTPLLKKAKKDFGFRNEWAIKPSKNNGYSARISGKDVSTTIKKWVFGETCNTKRLNLDCLLQNVEFRQGIIDGEYITDGGNTGRIYSTSYGLIKDLEVVLTSLGRHSVITESDRTDEPCIIRGKEFNRNFILYTIKYYIPNNVRGQKDLFKTINNTMYFKIKSIEEMKDYDKKDVYCFEMKNKEEPYFTLPEGIITHNCRLKNDTSLLKGNFNSIGGTSLSIGSVKVITLNLVRCALESKNEEEFYKNVAEKTALVHDALEVQRSIIEKNIAKGLSPLNDAGLIQLKNQYSTVGINGIFEAVKLLGGIEYKEETGYNYTEKGKQMAIKIMNVINDLNVARSQELGFTFNMEQVPFESGSVKHYKKDRLLYQDRIDNEIGTGIYGNQWIPLNIDCSLFHRLEMSALLDKEASGGAILHINRSNKITPEQNYENMIAYAKMGIVYYSDIIKMNICENDHTYTQGSDICPICGGKKVDEAIKVVGYIVRKSAFQKERKKEMDERVFYKK